MVITICHLSNPRVGWLKQIAGAPGGIEKPARTPVCRRLLNAVQGRSYRLQATGAIATPQKDTNFRIMSNFKAILRAHRVAGSMVVFKYRDLFRY